jgi:hypothetical protein
VICGPGHAANNPKAAVPWSALLNSPNKFLDKCYLPDGVLLTEISKMKGGALNACINHWSGRIGKGEIAFRFKAVEDSHLREVDVKKKRRAPRDKEPAESSPRKRSADDEDGDQASASDGHNSDQELAHAGQVIGEGNVKVAPELWYEDFSYAP